MKLSVNDHLANIRTTGLLIAIVGSAFSITVCAVGLVTCGIGFLLQLGAAKDYDWRVYPHKSFVILLLLSLGVSLFVSDYFDASMRGLMKYLQGFLLLYVGLDVIRNRTSFKLVLKVLVFCYMIVILAGLTQYFLGYDFVYFRLPVMTDVYAKIRGPFKHYNNLGTFLVPGFSLAAAFVVNALSQGKWRQGTFASIFFVLLTFVIFKTLSRSALISIFASLFLFSMFYRFRRWSTLMIAASLAGLWLVPSQISERLHQLLNFHIGSISERLLLLRISTDMVQVNPLFGLGLNTYSLNYGRFTPPDYPGQMYTHNSFLQMATEAGLIGTGLYILVVGIFLWSFMRATKRLKEPLERNILIGITAGLFGFLVNCLFESCFQTTQLRTLFWVLMGVGSALAFHPLTPPDKSQVRNIPERELSHA